MNINLGNDVNTGKKVNVSVSSPLLVHGQHESRNFAISKIVTCRFFRALQTVDNIYFLSPKSSSANYSSFDALKQSSTRIIRSRPLKKDYSKIVRKTFRNRSNKDTDVFVVTSVESLKKGVLRELYQKTVYDKNTYLTLVSKTPPIQPSGRNVIITSPYGKLLRKYQVKLNISTSQIKEFKRLYKRTKHSTKHYLVTTNNFTTLGKVQLSSLERAFL